MTAAEYKKFVGKRIAEVQYEPGAAIAYIVTDDGDGIQVDVERTFDEEEE